MKINISSKINIVSRIGGGLVRVGAITLGGALAVAAAAGPAAADTAYFAAPHVPGASAYLGAVHWGNADKVSFNIGVRDTEADGEHAVGRVDARTPGGTVIHYREHAAFGEGTLKVTKTYAYDTRGISAIRITDCRKGDELPTWCGTSDWLPRS